MLLADSIDFNLTWFGCLDCSEYGLSIDKNDDLITDDDLYDNGGGCFLSGGSETDDFLEIPDILDLTESGLDL